MSRPIEQQTEAVRAARTKYAHTRQQVVCGLATMKQLDEARAAYREADAVLDSLIADEASRRTPAGGEA